MLNALRKTAELNLQSTVKILITCKTISKCNSFHYASYATFFKRKLPILLNLKFWRVPFCNQEAENITFIQRCKPTCASPVVRRCYRVVTALDSTPVDYLGEGHTFIKVVKTCSDPITLLAV